MMQSNIRKFMVGAVAILALAAGAADAKPKKALPPPPPPPVSGAEDVETLRAKALEIDRKRHSGDTSELKEQSRQAWDAFRKAQRAKQQH